MQSQHLSICVGTSRRSARCHGLAADKRHVRVKRAQHARQRGNCFQKQLGRVDDCDAVVAVPYFAEHIAARCCGCC